MAQPGAEKWDFLGDKLLVLGKVWNGYNMTGCRQSASNNPDFGNVVN
jgi:hypothetical protein